MFGTSCILPLSGIDDHPCQRVWDICPILQFFFVAIQVWRPLLSVCLLVFCRYLGLATTTVSVFGTSVLLGLSTACETLLSQAFGEKNYKVYSLLLIKTNLTTRIPYTRSKSSRLRMVRGKSAQNIEHTLLHCRGASRFSIRLLIGNGMMFKENSVIADLC